MRIRNPEVCSFRMIKVIKVRVWVWVCGGQPDRTTTYYRSMLQHPFPTKNRLEFVCAAVCSS